MNDKMRMISKICGFLSAILMCFALIIMLFILFYQHKENRLLEEERQKVTKQIVSLSSIDCSSLSSIDCSSQLEGSIKGSFYMGYGNVKGELGETQYYVTYRILEDGGKKLYKLPADVTIIYDTLEVGSQAYAEVDSNYYGVVSAKVYVPVGTIVQDYDLSLED